MREISLFRPVGFIIPYGKCLESVVFFPWQQQRCSTTLLLPSSSRMSPFCPSKTWHSLLRNKARLDLLRRETNIVASNLHRHMYVPFQQWHTQHIDATPTPMESHGGNEFNRAKNNPQSLPLEYEKDVRAESNFVSPGAP